VLQRIAKKAAQSQPQLFARLGEHAAKRFLIDPVDLPLTLMLTPHPHRPGLAAHRRAAIPPHDVRIAATFGTLLRLLDGTLDSDAVFFQRNLHISGEMDAAVSLRNALDDYRGSIVDDALRALGLFCRPASLLLRPWRDS